MKCRRSSMQGAMCWSLDNLEGPLRALREWDWSSDHLNLLSELSSVSLDGRGGLDMFVCHTGPEEQAREEIARLRSFGAPDEEEMSVVPFSEVTFMFDDAYAPCRTTINDQPVGALGDDLVDALVAKIRELTRRLALHRDPHAEGRARPRAGVSQRAS